MGVVANLRGPQGPPGPGASSYPASALNVFVDYANGNDSNAGLSPTPAFKTIQAAYNALRAAATGMYVAENGHLGVGRIHLLPGKHDIGAGLVFDPRNPVELLGTTSGRRWHISTNSASQLVSSSDPATWIDCTDGTHQSWGFLFRDLAFLVNTASNPSATSLMKVAGDNLSVERCVFDTLGRVNTTTLRAIFQCASPNLDNAWFRIHENDCARMCLWHAETGVNFNRGSVLFNEVFYDGDGTLPMVYFQGDVQFTTVGFNNFEGGAKAVQLDSSSADRNLFLNNAGEDNTAGTRPFYHFNGSCQYNQIYGGSVHRSGAGASLNGIFAQFEANAHSNIVEGPFNAAGFAGYKQRIVDNSTLGNIIRNPSGTKLQVKSGAGLATAADSDFRFGAEDGQQEILWNTAAGTYKLATRVNGAWKYVTIA